MSKPWHCGVLAVGGGECSGHAVPAVTGSPSRPGCSGRARQATGEKCQRVGIARGVSVPGAE